MLDRTTKTGPEKPSPQKLKTKGTHLLKLLTAFFLLESVGAADTTPKMLGSILVVLIPLDGQEPFHSAAEVSTALYGYEEGTPEEAVPSFRRTAAGNVLEVYCESALMTKDNCVGMMTGVTVRNFDDLLPPGYAGIGDAEAHYRRPFNDYKDGWSTSSKMKYWFERLLEETDEGDFYDRKIAIYPAGYGGAGSYYSPSTDVMILTFTQDTWTTYAHELGHAIGLPHSSAPSSSHAMDTYGDEALMGRRDGKTDFNAASRYQLGWIEAAAVLEDSGILKPLNVEATVTVGEQETFLVLKQECAECWSKNATAGNEDQDKPGKEGGTLIASFRVGRDAGGDNNDFGIVGANLVNKVHVHYLPDDVKKVGEQATIQRWAVLAEGEAYEWRSAPDGTGLVLGGLVVCKLVSTAESTEVDYAAIAVGTNAADARTKCATNTISSAITCSGGVWQREVGWSLSCSDGTTLSGGAPYPSSVPLVVELGARCTLIMTDSYGDGWNGNVWAAPGFGQSFSLANGNWQGAKSFVVGSPTFEVVSGSCTVKSDKCVYSDNFGPGQKYSDKQDCVIKQNVPFQLDVRSFDVENHGTCTWDFLEVDGQRYCGTKGPQGRTPAAGSELVWHTDDSFSGAGFKICMTDSPPITISAITCSGGSWEGEVGWSLSCSDGTTLSGGAPYPSSVPLAVLVGATCTLDMTDSYGDGWNGNVWAAPGFGQRFSLANGKQGAESFVVQPGTSG